jgi:hypothetical protein
MSNHEELKFEEGWLDCDMKDLWFEYSVEFGCCEQKCKDSVT